jgi:glucokinase
MRPSPEPSAGDAGSVLVADVGATSTRLAVVAGDWASHFIVKEALLPSRECRGLEAVLRDFLRDSTARPRDAVLAVAGPVVDGRAELTNLGWTLDEGSLTAGLDLRSVRLVNDLVAMASAVPYLDPGAFVTLQAGLPVSGGTIAVVAPGTGLGEAFLTWDGGEYRAHASEGGHADFAPIGRLQQDLLDYLRTRYDHVSRERVCSGRALPDLFGFLEARRAAVASEVVMRRLEAADDRTPVIVEAGLSARPCPLCLATLELFSAILAAEAGNLALHVLATGGVYLSGGLPRRLLPLLQRSGFLARFALKGRLSPMLARIPLSVIVRPSVGLVGAIRCALAGVEQRWSGACGRGDQHRDPGSPDDLVGDAAEQQPLYPPRPTGANDDGVGLDRLG